MTTSVFTSTQSDSTQADATQAKTRKSSALAIFASVMLGFSTLFVVGHLQAETLHDAAHDARHASGFPCH